MIIRNIVSSNKNHYLTTTREKAQIFNERAGTIIKISCCVSCTESYFFQKYFSMMRSTSNYANIHFIFDNLILIPFKCSLTMPSSLNVII
jgi:hypothetical protein